MKEKIKVNGKAGNCKYLSRHALAFSDLLGNHDDDDDDCLVHDTSRAPQLTLWSTTVGELVTVNKEKAKIIVTADMAFSKRYLKYLAKKYLKKHSVWLTAQSRCPVLRIPGRLSG